MVDDGSILTAQLVSFGVLAIPTVLVLASLIRARQHPVLLRVLLAIPTVAYPVLGPLMVIVILLALEVGRQREKAKRRQTAVEAGTRQADRLSYEGDHTIQEASVDPLDHAVPAGDNLRYGAGTGTR